jgi:SAM-dependent methyltransferase
MISMNNERIEILSVELLENNRKLVDELKQFAKSIGLEFGWHYLLDLTWIINQLDSSKMKYVMDAGAGTGVIQWYLATQGLEVISVDRTSRANLPLRFRKEFNVKGLREKDLSHPTPAFLNNFKRPIKGSLLYRILATGKAQMLDISGYYSKFRNPGSVIIYNQDLTNLVDLQDNSLDAIVSVSALEHNTPEGLTQVVDELMRVLKPGGILLATLTAARDNDFWHEASSAMCYTDNSLRTLFSLSPDSPSNYDEYDKLFTKLKDSKELRGNLASFYTTSTQKGMPQGIWDPQYQPVGVLKVKHG